MLNLGVGDLASSLISRRSNGSLKTELVKLSQELGSGRVSDISASTKGNLAPLASIERSLVLNNAFSVSASQVNIKLNYQQAAISRLHDDVSQFGPQLLTASEGGRQSIEPIISQAAQLFHSAVSGLSTNIGGVYVFSGVSADTAPLQSSTDLLSALRSSVTGITTAEGFFQQVDDWFTSAGGFGTVGYTGGPAGISGTQIGESDEIRLPLTANTEEIRNALRDLAVVALMGAGDFLGPDAEYLELGQKVGAASVESADGLVQTEAQIGLLQQRVEQITAQSAAQRVSLTLAKNELSVADPFETATKLEEVQFQLESLYLVTAKTARLSLTEYLR